MTRVLPRALLCFASLAALSSSALAQPSKAVSVTLPKDAYARKWNGTGSNALIIPTYNQHNAPKLISVNGREYYRNSFNLMQSGQRTFMAYTETPDSSMKAHQAVMEKREQQNRRNSW